MSSLGATLAAPFHVRLDDILRASAIHPAFQPLVDLRSSGVVGYEALARGPQGSALEMPASLFDAARHEDRLAELDEMCRIAAFRAATDAGIGGGHTLFVNLEPSALAAEGWKWAPIASFTPPPGVRVVVEITERALTSEPAGLLRAVTDLRSRGFGIAVDDVGADMRSLALMPFLRPDVIKLDLRLVQHRPSVEIAQILAAVSAQVERIGASVVAEGIETEEHVAVAVSLGATLGQGYYFGRPAPLPRDRLLPRTRVRLLGPVSQRDGVTPYEVIRGARPAKRAKKPLLRAISRALELEAAALGEASVVIAAFQDERFFTPAVRATYRNLGQRLAFAGVLGAGLSEEPEPGVRGGHLSPDDPLTREWNVAVIGPHFSATLAAWDVGDTSDDRERRFDYVVSHDRDLALEAARSMMLRMAPEPGAQA